MQLGNWQLDSLNGGMFRLDGGVMFGVVPKTLWQAVAQPDQRNRILCANRCVLARDGTHTVLIDTGYGGKYGPLDRRFYAMEPGEPLVASLVSLGVTPDEIDTVVFSHLHFDHVGGATRHDQHAQLVLTFPQARHVVGRWEWHDATRGGEELQTAYARDGILPLADAHLPDRRRGRNRARSAGATDRRAHAWPLGATVRIGGPDRHLPERHLPLDGPSAPHVALGL